MSHPGLQDPTYFDVVSGGYTLNFWAFGLVLVLSLLLCWGIRETKTVNNIITVVHVGVVIFIIVAGLTKAEVAPWPSPFISIKPETLPLILRTRKY